MEENFITVNKSKIIKMIAIMMMIFLHCFMNESNYVSLTKPFGFSIEKIISNACGICVGIFTFLSGYGLYITIGNEKNTCGRLTRIKNILYHYWFIFLIFIPIGVLLGKYEFNVKRIILNFFLIQSNYNYEWWYMTFYIIMLAVYPFCLKIIEKKWNIIVSFFLMILGMGMVKFAEIFSQVQIIYRIIDIVFIWQFLFVLGMYFSKYKIFDKFNYLKNKKMVVLSLFVLMISLFIIADIPVIGEIYKMLSVVPIIYCLSLLITENTILLKLSKYCTDIWLTHTFITTYFLSEFIYSLKNTIVIYVVAVILSLFLAYLTETLFTMIKK